MSIFPWFSCKNLRLYNDSPFFLIWLFFDTLLLSWSILPRFARFLMLKRIVFACPFLFYAFLIFENIFSSTYFGFDMLFYSTLKFQDYIANFIFFLLKCICIFNTISVKYFSKKWFNSSSLPHILIYCAFITFTS